MTPKPQNPIAKITKFIKIKWLDHNSLLFKTYDLQFLLTNLVVRLYVENQQNKPIHWLMENLRIIVVSQ